MKKITFLTFLMFSFFGFSQSYTTGDMTLNSIGGTFLMTGKIDVNTSTVTLTMTGPANSWFGMGFGATSMSDGTGDVVLFDGTTLSDRQFTGSFSAPNVDATQNWTLISNTVNGSDRTIVGTRLLNTGDPNDYIFTNSASPLVLVYARGQSLIIAYHGGDSCGTTNTNLTLGLEDFSLKASEIYPNPTQGNFTIRTKTNLEKVTIYSQTGSLIKTIELPISSNNEIEINATDLQSGIYLLELQNESEKSWKKLIVN